MRSSLRRSSSHLGRATSIEWCLMAVTCEILLLVLLSIHFYELYCCIR